MQCDGEGFPCTLQLKMVVQSMWVLHVQPLDGKLLATGCQMLKKFFAIIGQPPNLVGRRLLCYFCSVTILTFSKGIYPFKVPINFLISFIEINKLILAKNCYLDFIHCQIFRASHSDLIRHLTA